MLCSREFLFLSNPFHPNYDIEASILAHLKFQYNTDLFLMNEEYINSKTLINPQQATRYFIFIAPAVGLEPTSRPVGITATLYFSFKDFTN